MGSSPSKPAVPHQSPHAEPPQVKKSLFLALPAELRVKIYKALIEPKEIVSRRTSPGGKIPNVEIKEPAIMAVCRLLRQESQPIFYDGLKLVIDRNNLFEPPRDSIRSLDLISPEQLHQIRYIEIPWTAEMTISIFFSSAPRHASDHHSAIAQGAGFHVLVTSSAPYCGQKLCIAIAELVRDFLLCLIIHRARIRVCGSLGPSSCRPRATGKKSVLVKGEKLEFLKRGEVEWLLSHLKFDGRHLLRGAGVLSF